MYVALHPERRPTIGEVAGSYDISKNHVMKVVYQLGLAGYVETVRGQSGGMRLAKPPQDIILGEVVRRTEPDLALVPCFAAEERLGERRHLHHREVAAVRRQDCRLLGFKRICRR